MRIFAAFWQLRLKMNCHGQSVYILPAVAASVAQDHGMSSNKGRNREASNSYIRRRAFYGESDGKDTATAQTARRVEARNDFAQRQRRYASRQRDSKQRNPFRQSGGTASAGLSLVIEGRRAVPLRGVVTPAGHAAVLEATSTTQVSMTEARAHPSAKETGCIQTAQVSCVSTCSKREGRSGGVKAAAERMASVREVLRSATTPVTEAVAAETDRKATQQRKTYSSDSSGSRERRQSILGGDTPQHIIGRVLSRVRRHVAARFSSTERSSSSDEASNGSDSREWQSIYKTLRTSSVSRTQGIKGKTRASNFRQRTSKAHSRTRSTATKVFYYSTSNSSIRGRSSGSISSGDYNHRHFADATVLGDEGKLIGRSRKLNRGAVKIRDRNSSSNHSSSNTSSSCGQMKGKKEPAALRNSLIQPKSLLPNPARKTLLPANQQLFDGQLLQTTPSENCSSMGDSLISQWLNYSSAFIVEDESSDLADIPQHLCVSACTPFQTPAFNIRPRTTPAEAKGKKSWAQIVREPIALNPEDKDFILHSKPEEVIARIKQRLGFLSSSGNSRCHYCCSTRLSSYGWRRRDAGPCSRALFSWDSGRPLSGTQEEEEATQSCSAAEEEDTSGQQQQQSREQQQREEDRGKLSLGLMTCFPGRQWLPSLTISALEHSGVGDVHKNEPLERQQQQQQQQLAEKRLKRTLHISKEQAAAWKVASQSPLANLDSSWAAADSRVVAAETADAAAEGKTLPLSDSLLFRLSPDSSCCPVSPSEFTVDASPNRQQLQQQQLRQQLQQVRPEYSSEDGGTCSGASPEEVQQHQEQQKPQQPTDHANCAKQLRRMGYPQQQGSPHQQQQQQQQQHNKSRAASPHLKSLCQRVHGIEGAAAAAQQKMQDTQRNDPLKEMQQQQPAWMTPEGPLGSPKEVTTAAIGSQEPLQHLQQQMGGSATENRTLEGAEQKNARGRTEQQQPQQHREQQRQPSSTLGGPDTVETYPAAATMLEEAVTGHVAATETKAAAERQSTMSAMSEAAAGVTAAAKLPNDPSVCESGLEASAKAAKCTTAGAATDNASIEDDAAISNGSVASVAVKRPTVLESMDLAAGRACCAAAVTASANAATNPSTAAADSHTAVPTSVTAILATLPTESAAPSKTVTVPTLAVPSCAAEGNSAAAARSVPGAVAPAAISQPAVLETTDSGTARTSCAATITASATTAVYPRSASADTHTTVPTVTALCAAPLTESGASSKSAAVPTLALPPCAAGGASAAAAPAQATLENAPGAADAASRAAMAVSSVDEPSGDQLALGPTAMVAVSLNSAPTGFTNGEKSPLLRSCTQDCTQQPRATSSSRGTNCKNCYLQTPYGTSTFAFAAPVTCVGCLQQQLLLQHHHVQQHHGYPQAQPTVYQQISEQRAEQVQPDQCGQLLDLSAGISVHPGATTAGEAGQQSNHFQGQHRQEVLGRELLQILTAAIESSARSCRHGQEAQKSHQSGHASQGTRNMRTSRNMGQQRARQKADVHIDQQNAEYRKEREKDGKRRGRKWVSHGKRSCSSSSSCCYEQHRALRVAEQNGTHQEIRMLSATRDTTECVGTHRQARSQSRPASLVAAATVAATAASAPTHLPRSEPAERMRLNCCREQRKASVLTRCEAEEQLERGIRLQQRCRLLRLLQQQLELQ